MWDDFDNNELNKNNENKESNTENGFIMSDSSKTAGDDIEKNTGNDFIFSGKSESERNDVGRDNEREFVFSDSFEPKSEDSVKDTKDDFDFSNHFESKSEDNISDTKDDFDFSNHFEPKSEDSVKDAKDDFDFSNHFESISDDDVRSTENDFVFSNASEDTGKDDKEPKEKKKSGKWAKLIPTAIAFGAIAGGVFTGVSYAGGVATGTIGGNASSQTQIATAIPVSDSDTDKDKTPALGNPNVTTIANAILPAMVEIVGKATVSQNTFFGPQNYQAQASGTGIIVGKNEDELLILTNAHVVEEMDDLECKFVNEKTAGASIKGSSSADDVAVVAVKLKDMDEETAGAIAIAQLDDSNSEVVGQPVVAIGNALGEGQSVTVGYISALNRSIDIDSVKYTGLIMTDAAINSGNSGGALISSEGKVIGINFAKDGSYGVENMAYSIPISKVKDLIDSLMTQETREKVSDAEAGFLGISGIDITSDIHAQYGYPQGLMIRSVEEGSAAQKAGLDAYDIITSFDGKSVTTLSSLQGIMKYYKKGETVDITYYHMENSEYVQKTTQATLDAAK